MNIFLYIYIYKYENEQYNTIVYVKYCMLYTIVEDTCIYI